MKVPWVVRFEDIDTPRVVKGALETQLEDLAALGLIPDRFYLQSERRPRHWEVFRRMLLSRDAYPCTCTRKEIRDAVEASASAPHAEPPVYNGRCRETAAETRDLPSVAWRFRGQDPSGAQDLVIARTRGLDADAESFMPSYPLACAVDDLDGNYSLVVRAWDLAQAGEAQRRIQNWLLQSKAGLPGAENPLKPPPFFHTTLITQNDGHRLEKRTRGVTLPELFAKGVTKERILESFSKSFSIYSIDSGGETERTRTLASLGFQ